MYDVIIIGAGISGLVCGCFLAKAGMKVLILEQHTKPGGYCTSFRREKFMFDSAPHCFGSYRENGLMRKILEDLNIDSKLNIKRAEPSDIIVTPDYTITFWNNLEKTIEDLQTTFPEERNINKFIYSLIDTNPNSFSRMRSWTFKKLLDEYFTDDKLKAILSFPFLGIGGLPSSMISAFVGAKLYSEFIFDGGYYPEGGMQSIPYSLAEKFKEFGGELRLSNLTKKIKVKNNNVLGIISEKDGFVPSKYVISGCDARQTYLNLLGEENIENDFCHKIKSMIPSISNFVLYLGINDKLETILKPGTTYSFFSHYDTEKAYQSVQTGDIKNYGGFMLRVAHDKSTIIAIMPASYNDMIYWKNHKNGIKEFFIKKIENNLIPNLSEYIEYQDAATPYTLYRYTLNYRGASFGWAALSSQLAIHDLRKPSFIKGFYLIGHWTTLGVGVSGAAYVGYDTAKIILRKEKF